MRAGRTTGRWCCRFQKGLGSFGLVHGVPYYGVFFVTLFGRSLIAPGTGWKVKSAAYHQVMH